MKQIVINMRNILVAGICVVLLCNGCASGEKLSDSTKQAKDRLRQMQLLREYAEFSHSLDEEYGRKIYILYNALFPQSFPPDSSMDEAYGYIDLCEVEENVILSNVVDVGYNRFVRDVYRSRMNVVLPDDVAQSTKVVLTKLLAYEYYYEHVTDLGERLDLPTMPCPELRKSSLDQLWYYIYWQAPVRDEHVRQVPGEEAECIYRIFNSDKCTARMMEGIIHNSDFINYGELTKDRLADCIRAMQQIKSEWDPIHYQHALCSIYFRAKSLHSDNDQGLAAGRLAKALAKSLEDDGLVYVSILSPIQVFVGGLDISPSLLAECIYNMNDKGLRNYILIQWLELDDESWEEQDKEKAILQISELLIKRRMKYIEQKKGMRESSALK